MFGAAWMKLGIGFVVGLNAAGIKHLKTPKRKKTRQFRSDTATSIPETSQIQSRKPNQVPHTLLSHVAFHGMIVKRF